MKSMTGYGNSRTETQLVELEVSIKTVNGRFLETRFHMPREYQALEAQLKRTINEYIRRGTVDISIYRKPGPTASQGDVSIQLDLARKWVQSYQELGRSLGLEPNLDLRQIANHPEILKIEERAEVSAPETKQLFKTFEAALSACDEEREREGKALDKDLSKHLDKLEKLREGFESHREQANREIANRLKTRLAKLEDKTPVDEQRIAQEIALYLDRSDIAEELSRLEEHLINFRKLMKSREAVGKKLDFYTQELLREVNTIGSKAQLAKLTELVVDAKAVIERIREQVQNIE